MEIDKSIGVLLGGLGLCGAACLLAPVAPVAGAATLAAVAGGALAGAGQALAPNIAADIFSRFADWTKGKLRDKGAAAKNHDLRDLVVLSIENVLDDLIKTRPGGAKGVKLLKGYRAKVRNRQQRAAVDDRFKGTWEQTVPHYFKARLEEFASVKALTPDIWKHFLNEVSYDALNADEQTALETAANALYNDLPKHLVGVYRDALQHHPTIFVAVQTAILQEIWNGVSRIDQKTDAVRALSQETHAEIRSVGNEIAKTNFDAIKTLAEEFTTPRGEFRVLAWTIEYLSRETLQILGEMRENLKNIAVDMSATRKSEEGNSDKLDRVIAGQEWMNRQMQAVLWNRKFETAQQQSLQLSPDVERMVVLAEESGELVLQRQAALIRGDLAAADDIQSRLKQARASLRLTEAFDDAMYEGDRAYLGNDPSAAAIAFGRALVLRPEDAMASANLAAALCRQLEPGEHADFDDWVEEQVEALEDKKSKRSQNANRAADDDHEESDADEWIETEKDSLRQNLVWYGPGEAWDGTDEAPWRPSSDSRALSKRAEGHFDRAFMHLLAQPEGRTTASSREVAERLVKSLEPIMLEIREARMSDCGLETYYPYGPGSRRMRQEAEIQNQIAWLRVDGLEWIERAYWQLVARFGDKEDVEGALEDALEAWIDIDPIIDAVSELGTVGAGWRQYLTSRIDHFGDIDESFRKLTTRLVQASGLGSRLVEWVVQGAEEISRGDAHRDPGYLEVFDLLEQGDQKLVKEQIRDRYTLLIGNATATASREPSHAAAILVLAEFLERPDDMGDCVLGLYKTINHVAPDLPAAWIKLLQLLKDKPREITRLAEDAADAIRTGAVSASKMDTFAQELAMTEEEGASARLVYSAIHEVAPEIIYAGLTLASLHATRPDGLASAAGVYRRLREIAPNDTTVAGHYGRFALKQLGDARMALPLLTEAKSIVEFRRPLCEAIAATGRFEEAAELLGTGVPLDPNGLTPPFQAYCWFAILARRTRQGHGAPTNALHKLLVDQGVRVPDVDFNTLVALGTRPEHRRKEWMPLLADVIAGTRDPSVLNEWYLWRLARAGQARTDGQTTPGHSDKNRTP